MTHIPTDSERAARIRLKCKHFSGTMSKTCRAGIAYDSVQFDREGAKGRRFLLPCIKETEGEFCACPSGEFPTREESEAAVAQMHKRSQEMRIARATITEATGGKRRVSGRVKCPVCDGGTLHFTVAYNGHVHAACTTQGCMRWME